MLEEGRRKVQETRVSWECDLRKEEKTKGARRSIENASEVGSEVEEGLQEGRSKLEGSKPASNAEGRRKSTGNKEVE